MALSLPIQHAHRFQTREVSFSRRSVSYLYVRECETELNSPVFSFHCFRIIGVDKPRQIIQPIDRISPTRIPMGRHSRSDHLAPDRYPMSPPQLPADAPVALLPEPVEVGLRIA